jgi:hypothetical protein
MYRSTWSASRPGCFTPGESVPGTHWIERWVSPRTGLDDVEGRKILLLPGLNSDTSAIHPVASHYTNCAIPAHLCIMLLSILRIIIVGQL